MSDAKVVKLYTREAAKDPDAVLEQAIGQYSDVLILGWDKEGFLDPRATLGLKSKDLLWLMEIFKFNLLSGMYEDQ